MRLIISSRVQAKLAAKESPVSREEIVQCFANRTGKYLLDTREEHASNPPTRWFIAETDYGRKLKVVFIQDEEKTIIRSAFEPNGIEKTIYSKYA